MVRRGEARDRERSLGKQRVLARRGWAGENAGIFSSRLQVSDGALKNGDLRHRIA